MTVDDFKMDYDNAPDDFDDFAYAASKVDDDRRLEYAAKYYIEAKAKFEAELKRVGVEIG